MRCLLFVSLCEERQDVQGKMSISFFDELSTPFQTRGSWTHGIPKQTKTRTHRINVPNWKHLIPSIPTTKTKTKQTLSFHERKGDRNEHRERERERDGPRDPVSMCDNVRERHTHGDRVSLFFFLSSKKEPLPNLVVHDTPFIHKHPPIYIFFCLEPWMIPSVEPKMKTPSTTYRYLRSIFFFL